VTPVFIPTPVHPEKITHPGSDSMGTVTAAHAPWWHSAKVEPALSVPQLPGIDVSSYQGNINWGAVAPYIDFSYGEGPHDLGAHMPANAPQPGLAGRGSASTSAASRARHHPRQDGPRRPADH
jgi:hypothetical protein